MKNSLFMITAVAVIIMFSDIAQADFRDNLCKSSELSVSEDSTKAMDNSKKEFYSATVTLRNTGDCELDVTKSVSLFARDTVEAFFGRQKSLHGVTVEGYTKYLGYSNSKCLKQGVKECRLVGVGVYVNIIDDVNRIWVPLNMTVSAHQNQESRIGNEVFHFEIRFESSSLHNAALSSLKRNSGAT